MSSLSGEIVLEYLSTDNIPIRFAFDNSAQDSSAFNIDINYLDDTRYLFNVANGYVDVSGNPTQKLYNTLKNIESINASTWEYLVSNITIMDKRPLRGGKTRAIPTYYNISGETSRLITGIGDHSDIELININQERDPLIMSRDLFISNLNGFMTGGTSGIVTEIDYSQILNPVNTSNINNFYGEVRHGYLYSGEVEYYLYGAKQTEIFEKDSYYQIDEDGYRWFALSGYPNNFSPIIINSQSGTILFIKIMFIEKLILDY
jgi:hypothetical protein